MCSCVSFMSAQTHKTEEEQLDSIVKELRESGSQQDPEENDSILCAIDSLLSEIDTALCEIDTIPCEFEVDSVSIDSDWPIVSTNNLEEVNYYDYKKDEILGAIKFAEEFIERIYLGQVNLGVPSMILPFAQMILNYDCSVYQNVTMAVINKVHNLKCRFVAVPNEDLLGFDVIDVSFYPYPFRLYQEPLSFKVLYDIATRKYYILTLHYDFNADEGNSNEGNPEFGTIGETCLEADSIGAEPIEVIPIEIVTEAAATDVEVRVLPTEQLGEIENRLTSGMDALGAIRFAEKFLQAVYDFDFSTMKAMICPHPDVQSFFTEEVYPFALKSRKRDGMWLNAQKGIYSKCEGLSDLDITTFSDTKDIPGYYKANVYFDASPKTEDAEFVSLRVMVFQNIEDGSFSIFSIK